VTAVKKAVGKHCCFSPGTVISGLKRSVPKRQQQGGVVVGKGEKVMAVDNSFCKSLGAS